mgnify:CR=1 FL=1
MVAKMPARKFAKVDARGDFYAGGFRVAADPDFQFEGKSPANKKDVIMSLGCSYAAGEEAIASAAGARDAWAATNPLERAGFVKALRVRIEASANELGDLISREIGKPRWESAWEISSALGRLDVCLQECAGQEQALQAGSHLREKPRGVALVLSHYNQPLESPLGYLIPALLSGNTVVYKPSKKAPGVGQKLAECFLEAGFPAGVFNRGQGGREMARRLAQHEHVDVIFYAGDYEFGKHLRKDTFDHNEKLLMLETGGKNPLIVWDDADMEAALREAIIAAYLTAGQRAEATSRLILHESIASEFIEKFHARAKKIEIGDPFSEDLPAFMGPLVDKKNVDRYLTFQGIAVREKAECIMRGKALSSDADGFFVSPSIYLFKDRSPAKILSSVHRQCEQLWLGGFGLHRARGEFPRALEAPSLWGDPLECGHAPSRVVDARGRFAA